MNTVTVGAAVLAIAAALIAGAIVMRRRGRPPRSTYELDMLRSELAAARSSATDARRRLQTVLPEAAEAAWAARALARRVVQRDSALQSQRFAAEAALAAESARAADLAESVRGLATALEMAQRSEIVATERVAALEAELTSSGGDIRQGSTEADWRATTAEGDAVAARREAAELARIGEGTRRDLLAAQLAVDELLRKTRALELDTMSASTTGEQLQDELERSRAALDEARRLAEATRIEVDGLAAELDRVRRDADLRVAAALASIPAPTQVTPSQGPDARLIAAQAEIRDLEERLATLAAARNAEIRRMGERIASLERLHIEIGTRDDRIVSLETELKETTEALETLRLEAADLDRRLRVTVVRLEESQHIMTDASAARVELSAARERVTALESAVAGSSRATAVEVDQLRAMLAAERERNVRLGHRVGLEPRIALETAVAAATRPLVTQIESLQAQLVTRAAPRGDEVTRIKGIGPKIAVILAGEGITSLRQIAAFTAADVERIGKLLPVYPGRIIRDRWVEQAREMVSAPG